MADDAPATPAAPQADATPAPVTESAPASPTSEAAEDAWLTANPAEGQITDTPGAQDPPQAEPEQPATESTPAEDPPAELSDADAQIVKRFQLDPVEVAAMNALSPQQKAAFLRSLQGRASYTDNLQRELKALKAMGEKTAEDPQPQTPPREAPPSPQPANGEQAFAALGEYFGDPEAARVFSTSFASAVQHELRPVLDGMARSDALMERILADDFERAFTDLELPEGIDKSDPVVQQELKDLAWELMEAKFHPVHFNPRHALPLAATHKYQSQITASAKATKAKAAQQALRRSPQMGTRTPSTAPQLSQEDREALALRGISDGLSGEALSRFVASGGRT